MIKLYFRFFLLLLISMIVAFLIQGSIQHFIGVGFLEQHIVPFYGFNFITTYLFFIILIRFVRKSSPNLGYIYLFSSFLKFLLFFAFIKPLLSHGVDVQRSDFISFFLPYSISLIVEITFIVRIMNRDLSSKFTKKNK